MKEKLIKVKNEEDLINIDINNIDFSD